jgi:hypothetical protein
MRQPLGSCRQQHRNAHDQIHHHCDPERDDDRPRYGARRVADFLTHRRDPRITGEREEQ